MARSLKLVMPAKPVLVQMQTGSGHPGHTCHKFLRSYNLSDKSTPSLCSIWPENQKILFRPGVRSRGAPLTIHRGLQRFHRMPDRDVVHVLELQAAAQAFGDDGFRLKRPDFAH